LAFVVKRSKYGSKKIRMSGIIFESKREWNCDLGLEIKGKEG